MAGTCLPIELDLPDDHSPCSKPLKENSLLAKCLSHMKIVIERELHYPPPMFLEPLHVDLGNCSFGTLYNRAKAVNGTLVDINNLKWYHGYLVVPIMNMKDLFSWVEFPHIEIIYIGTMCFYLDELHDLRRTVTKATQQFLEDNKDKKDV
jgi:hypothetical protein